MEQTGILLIIFLYYFLFIAVLMDLPEDISAMKSAVSRKIWKENHNQEKED